MCTMKKVHFPRWAEVLEQSDHGVEVKESYRVTVRWYLSWCARHGVACSVESARDFMSWAEREKHPKDWVLARWKDAIRWFFVTGRQQGSGLSVGSLEVEQVGHRVSEVAVCDEATESENGLEREQPMEGKTEDELQILATMRRLGMSLRTERSYLGHYRNFVRQQSVQDGCSMTASAVKCYLDHMAMDRGVASSTQKQALNALVFVAKQVFMVDLGEIGEYVRAKAGKRIPVVLSQAELRALFEQMESEKLLMAEVQYASGLRVSELVRLRIQDLDFSRGQIVIRSGKGNKDRIVPLSEKAAPGLRTHLELVETFFREDQERTDLAGVYLPEALARRHSNAGRDWRWQWVWPSRKVSVDPRSGKLRRHHVLDRAYQRTIREAALAAGITKRVTSHALRHSFATHMLENGTDIRTVQDLLGHRRIETTQTYLHVMQKLGAGVESPLDILYAS